MGVRLSPRGVMTNLKKIVSFSFSFCKVAFCICKGAFINIFFC